MGLGFSSQFTTNWVPWKLDARLVCWEGEAWYRQELQTQFVQMGVMIFEMKQTHTKDELDTDEIDAVEHPHLRAADRTMKSIHTS